MKTESTETQEKKLETLEDAAMQVLNETMESTIESPVIYDPEERFEIYKKYY